VCRSLQSERNIDTLAALRTHHTRQMSSVSLSGLCRLQIASSQLTFAAVYQIQTAGASLLITHATSLSTAEAAAKKAGIPTDRIIVLDSTREAPAQRKGPYPTILHLSKEDWRTGRARRKSPIFVFRAAPPENQRFVRLLFWNRLITDTISGSGYTSLFSHLQRDSIRCLLPHCRPFDPV